MKTCTGCGASYDDTSKFCPYCGTESVAAESTATEENGWQPENFKTDMESTKKHGMIWHKFVLAFLVIQGLINFLIGMNIINSYADQVATDSLVILKYILIAIGMIFIAIGVFSLIVFSRLGKRMRIGPKSLNTLYKVCISGNLFLLVLFSLTTRTMIAFGFRVIVSLIFNLLMLFINKRYYAKRENLFVN